MSRFSRRCNDELDGAQIAIYFLFFLIFLGYLFIKLIIKIIKGGICIYQELKDRRENKIQY